MSCLLLFAIRKNEQPKDPPIKKQKGKVGIKWAFCFKEEYIDSRALFTGIRFQKCASPEFRNVSYPNRGSIFTRSQVYSDRHLHTTGPAKGETHHSKGRGEINSTRHPVRLLCPL